MEKLLTANDVAEILGRRRKTVYDLVWRREIPALKINKKMLRFDPKDIQKWLDSKKTTAGLDPVVYTRVVT